MLYRVPEIFGPAAHAGFPNHGSPGAKMPSFTGVPLYTFMMHSTARPSWPLLAIPTHLGRDHASPPATLQVQHFFQLAVLHLEDAAPAPTTLRVRHGSPGANAPTLKRALIRCSGAFSSAYHPGALVHDLPILAAITLRCLPSCRCSGLRRPPSRGCSDFPSS